MKKYFITGLLALVPLIITIWVLITLIHTLDLSLALLPEAWQPKKLFGFNVLGLGALLTLVIIFVTGVVATNIFGQQLIVWWESLLSRVPFVKSIYSSVKQVSDTLFSNSGNAFRKAVLVQYPRAGSWTIAFVTGVPGVLPLVRTLRRETSLGVSVCLGTLNEPLYDELQAAGASLYIIKFELADAARYEQLEAPGTLAERLRHIRLLVARGWRVSSGFIAGLPGQGVDDLLANLRLARELPLGGCSVSPFIPGEATPLARAAMGDLDTTLNCMAALRLMRPELMIPAVSALNLTGADDGYRRGLRAGANLCTINLTPAELRADYLLYKRERFIMNEERVLNAIAAEGLEVSPTGMTEHWPAKPALAEAMAG